MVYFLKKWEGVLLPGHVFRAVPIGNGSRCRGDFFGFNLSLCVNKKTFMKRDDLKKPREIYHPCRQSGLRFALRSARARYRATGIEKFFEFSIKLLTRIACSRLQIPLGTLRTHA